MTRNLGSYSDLYVWFATQNPHTLIGTEDLIGKETTRVFLQLKKAAVETLLDIFLCHEKG